MFYPKINLFTYILSMKGGVRPHAAPPPRIRACIVLLTGRWRGFPGNNKHLATPLTLIRLFSALDVGVDIKCVILSVHELLRSIPQYCWKDVHSLT